jgi:hypothetical protein
MSRLARLGQYIADNEGAIRAGTGLNALVYLPAVSLSGGLFALFVGATGGWVAGQLTHRYGPAIRNGAVAGALGPLVATLIVVLAGLVTRPLLGTDVLFDAGVRLLGVAPTFVPLFAIQGAVGGLAASWFVTAARR